MLPADLIQKRVVIWGMGREGLAAITFLAEKCPDVVPIFVDEAAASPQQLTLNNYPIVRDPIGIAHALDHADVIIKSPGVSLYHPLLGVAKARGTIITSLLNLWFALPRRGETICVTGTKGKSTTSALIAHMLRKLGKKATLTGNIGVPVSEAASDADYIVIEISSYQAANFDGLCDFGVLTTLYPEHIDWHRSLNAYYRDKLNLLKHARTQIVNAEALPTLEKFDVTLSHPLVTNHQDGLHVRGNVIFDGGRSLGLVTNPHLARHHNLINVCLALGVVQKLGLDTVAALQGTVDFQGLPHRQHELGTRDAILYVDDSISTTPQSAIAAIDAYRDRPITLILGGYDRGIDYSPLIDYVLEREIHAVICLGASGVRMAEGLRQTRSANVFVVTTMGDAVATAQENTAAGGVILLSPAAPSYGLFKDFVARGEAFAAAAGFDV